MPSFLLFKIVTIGANIFLPSHRIGFFAKNNDPVALRTMSRFIGRRVFELFKIEFVGAIPNIHFEFMFKVVSAYVAGFPISGMIFIVMISAKRIAKMTSIATVPRIRKQNILVFVVAYPLPAAFGLCQFSCLAAQTASGNGSVNSPTSFSCLFDIFFFCHFFF